MTRVLKPFDLQALSIFFCIKVALVTDGACGSGGMFVQSMRFVDEHKGNRLSVSIYGQELTDTTRRLAKMIKKAPDRILDDLKKKGSKP